jgi:hypothetical protein
MIIPNASGDRPIIHANARAAAASPLSRRTSFHHGTVRYGFERTRRDYAILHLVLLIKGLTCILYEVALAAAPDLPPDLQRVGLALKA